MRVLPCLLAFLLCCSILPSCKKKPAYHLPAKKMEEVLYDISIAETLSIMAANNNRMGGAKNTDTLAHYYTATFARHHITKGQFDESMAWYKLHQEALDSVIKKVSERMDADVQAETKKKMKLP